MYRPLWRLLWEVMRIPQFGKRTPGKYYHPRPGAYGVVVNDKGEIGAVCKNDEYFLPGGGIIEGELREEALIREFREETGWKIRIIREIGRANDYVYSAARDEYFNKLGIFYLTELRETPAGRRADAVWVTCDQFRKGAFHESHIWAVERLLSD